MQRTSDDIAAAIEAALGKRPLDTVVRAGAVINVYTGSSAAADIGIHAGQIVRVGEISAADLDAAGTVIDWTDRTVVPGFIDSHFHFGGSHLAGDELARTLQRRGTTAIGSDLQEMYAFAGPEGVRAELDAATAAGLRILYLPPVHVLGLEDRGQYRHPVGAAEMSGMLAWAESVGVNEPPPNIVLRENRDVLELLAECRRRRLVFSGHAPDLHGLALQAYAAAGASADHESVDDAEAREKLELGMEVMLREGSAAVDLENVAPLLAAVPASRRHAMVCSDEQDPPSLVRRGNVDEKLRMLVRGGVDPLEALRMGTLNPAVYYRVDDLLGSIAPGRAADLVALTSLESFEVTDVVVAGRLAVAGGELTAERRPRPCPPLLVSDVRRAEPIDAATFRVEAAGGRARVRVMGIADGSLLVEPLTATVEVEDGNARPDPANDLLKVSVLERHGGDSSSATAFLSGFGLRDGAVATTYNHIHYNLLVLGTAEEQMAQAAAELAELGGGVVVVAGGKVVKRWELPLAGVCSLEPIEVVVRDFEETNGALVEHGCALSSAVIALSLLSVTTIPAYGITEKGLYDVAAEEFVPVVIGAEEAA